jgi:hypothetical protein
MARECVGFDPQRASRERPGEGALAARLILRLQDEYAADQERLARVLRTFQVAKERMLQEKADPRVVLVAALLAGAEADRGGLLLAELDLEPECRCRVAAIIEAIHAKNDLDSAEFRLVRAAWDQACTFNPGPRE